MDFKDYYKILGVEKTATADDIKKAYRKLARKYHPDVSKEADAAARMAEINEANTVLSDPEKRTAYDRLGTNWQAGMQADGGYQPPPNWDAGFEFTDGAEGFQGFSGDAGQYSDFFEQLFGRAAHAQRAQRGGHAGARAAMRGEDHHAKIELDLQDSYMGAERTITLQSARLDAQGQVVPEQRSLQVKIPKGVREGQMIRLAGQGSPGFNGGPAGDLLLQVVFRPDARWRSEGRDVYQRVRISPWEAAIGGGIEVATPTGNTVEVTVPAGSGSGRKLRLKGRGLPAAEPGDWYLELETAVPGAITPEQKTAWEALARAYPGFDPRRA